MTSIYLEKSYFTNHNSSAICGWFPIWTMIPVRENSEVLIICPYIYIYTGWWFQPEVHRSLQLSMRTIRKCVKMWWFQPPLKIWIRQLGWWHSQMNGKIKFMFQTTNQIYMIYNPFLVNSTDNSQRSQVLRAPRLRLSWNRSNEAPNNGHRPSGFSLGCEF